MPKILTILSHLSYFVHTSLDFRRSTVEADPLSVIFLILRKNSFSGFWSNLAAMLMLPTLTGGLPCIAPHPATTCPWSGSWWSTGPASLPQPCPITRRQRRSARRTRKALTVAQSTSTGFRYEKYALSFNLNLKAALFLIAVSNP